MRLIIFDCDGTLVDSQASIVACVQAAFAAEGLPLPEPTSVRRIVGLSLEPALMALLPEPDPLLAHRLALGYKEAFTQHRASPAYHEPLFPGTRELLDSLHARGLLLGVATGKAMRGLRFALEHHGLADRFVTLQTADRHPSKPHPSMALQAMADAGAAPKTTIVIGDTSYDMGMARAAGATGIGAGWGDHDEAELLAGGAVAVAEQPLDILQLIARLGASVDG